MSGSLPCVPERARGILQHRFFCSISTGMFYNVLPPQGFRMCSGLGRLLVPVITGPAFRTCLLPAWWSSVLKTWAPGLLPEQDLSSSEKPVSSCECCTPRKPAKCLHLLQTPRLDWPSFATSLLPCIKQIGFIFHIPGTMLRGLVCRKSPPLLPHLAPYLHRHTCASGVKIPL